MRFIDFYNKLNEDKLLKKKIKEGEGSAVLNPNIKSSNQNINGILKSDTTNQVQDIIQKIKNNDSSIINKDKEPITPIVVKPVFPIQNRAELSSVPITKQT